MYAAAPAGRPFEEGRETYARWVARVWQGRVGRVIEQLSERQEEVGLPRGGGSETGAPGVGARSPGCPSDHQDEMRYDEHRKPGLPMTGAVMGSTLERMNQRVRGTEKFWCAEGAGAIVQLRADHLSDGEPLDDSFERRQQNATGQRPDRRQAAA